jgi:hypothetical protein
MRGAKFTVEQVLEALDAGGVEGLPMLDNAYIDLADVRLSGFANDARWALVLEVIGFCNRLGLPDGLLTTVHGFGTCFPGDLAEDLRWGQPLRLIQDDPNGPALTTEDGWRISAAATSVRIRGQVVPIPSDPAVLAAKGIKLANPPHLRGEELLRALVPEQRERLLATEEELRRIVPPDLPLVIRLDEWHHPDLADDELPSATHTFQQIAEVLVWRDPNRYNPSEPPNTHWSNWTGR